MRTCEDGCNGCDECTDYEPEKTMTEVLLPLSEVGWRYVPSEVWGDQVLTQDPKSAQLAREYGRDVEPLYVLTQEDVAAVNAARKARAEKALRRLDLCRCDHNEYCRHCHPVEFRHGGVWAI